ncbi:YaeQ family protein [Shewanella sp. Isolate11]|uniref:YaeQ family protein n=1 Tax=Shewanella sp. Isolate11 TaxID=2908530 RepID=UPI001EFC4EDE|nr:YaeQ family protein [Shewanella sp. Isolate11]MCG9696373.1 YaeQ family protein [Shewanella sp. Isolate11]
MALKSTVYKAQLQIADMDRGYYQDHNLTLAQHPSETDARMMLRLLAFALNASDSLQFSKGLCVEDEPELWQKSLSDEIELWIDFGQSDEKWVRKACGRSQQVQLFAYGGRSVPIWWQQNQQAFSRYNNLKVWNIPEKAVKAMGDLVSRSMIVQFNICEGEIWMSNDLGSVQIIPEILKE